MKHQSPFAIIKSEKKQRIPAIGRMVDDMKEECLICKAPLEYLQEDIEIVVSTLKEREQDVVRMRYGLGNAAKRTLEEIGNIYGVTKECIRQTELRALKKMRLSSIGQEMLSGYIG